MSRGEFYHEALVRSIRERDDCDDDLRGACDEIEDCRDEIARLRLTDAERAAIERSVETLDGVEDLHPTACEADAAAVATLRKLLERTE